MVSSSPVPVCPIEVFFSYAHRDETLRDELAKHLSLLQHQKVIAGWYDRHIPAGTEWAGAIDAHLENAQIILLLISADFMASTYCYGIEMQRAMERHEAGQARVIPIILRAVDWHKRAVWQVASASQRWPRRDELGQPRRGVCRHRPWHPQRCRGTRAKPLMAPPGGTRPVGHGRNLSLPAIWNVPHRRNPSFTGRGDLLEALHGSGGETRPVVLTQVLRGLGGIGKTQLALEYAYRYGGTYRLVWWVRAEEPETLASDYAALAQALQLPQHAAQDQPEIIAAVRQWLERHEGWLLILDNAPEPAAIHAYLPRSPYGHIVITSRHFGWGRTAKSLTVPVLPRQEAVTAAPGGDAAI